ncbi:lipoate--protein ligase [Gudongella sp. DL1XJH-153]|uniref:lipoate--protein ligase n=1 Tax=Gudongella sp. DL1XJH-153 TaxID=3409804 RepID=UPI003BB5DE84
MKYLTNLSNNPNYNLAFEEYCFKNLPREDDYVYLWINGPAIIVGKNQNTLEEINIEYVKENDIKIVRRITGGGAVYHDLGNLNFSIYTNSKGQERIDFGQINVPILKSLEKFGIMAELSGRNDLTLDGKKISGIAQSVYKKRILNHGTILYDTDMSVLSKALNVKADKIASKGVKSVKSRVTNIRPYMKEDALILDFKEMLLKNIFQYHNEEMEEYVLSQQELDGIQKLYEEKYSTWEWNYGESPDFGWTNYKRFPSGAVEVRLEMKNGIIRDVKIFGDFFGTKEVEDLEEKLKGVRYDKDNIQELLSEINVSDYFSNMADADFMELLFD